LHTTTTNGSKSTSTINIFWSKNEIKHLLECQAITGEPQNAYYNMQGLQGYCMTAQSSVLVHALNYLHTELELFICALTKLQWNAKNMTYT